MCIRDSYKSLEFIGPGVQSLTMEDRLCICNMAIEAGAKNGIFPVDETCEAYLKGRSRREWKKYEADPDAEYERTITIDLDTLVPTVSWPHLPENCLLYTSRHTPSGQRRGSPVDARPEPG